MGMPQNLSFRVDKPYLGSTADNSWGLARQELQLPLETIGVSDIVGIHPRDPMCATLLNPGIEGCRNALPCISY